MSSRLHFVKVTSQVRLCEVLVMWPKLTPDGIVSLSAMIRSLAIVYTARCLGRLIMEKEPAASEDKNIEVFITCGMKGVCFCIRSPG